MKRRNLFIIIGVCVLTVAGGVYLYSVLTKKKTVTKEGIETPVAGTEDIKIQLSSEDKKKGATAEIKKGELAAKQSPSRQNFEDVVEVTIRKMMGNAVLRPTLAADKKKILYFDPALEEFSQVNLDGADSESITSAGFKNVYDFTWANSKDRAMIAFSSDAGFTKRFLAFNFNDQTYNNLGENVKAAALSPDGKKIIYLYRDTVKAASNLTTADFGGSKWKIIGSLNQEEVNLWWPTPFRAITADALTGFKATNLYSLGITDGNLKTLIGDSFGISFKVSPDGKKVLYSTSSVARPKSVKLYVTDIDGKAQVDLGLQTLADKCGFAQDNRTVYCGVPQRAYGGFVLPDDYLAKKFVTEDSLYRIDSETGGKEKIGSAADFNETYDVYDPFVSESGKTVYFTRRQDGMLYALIMPK